jgi:hypothetical protein
MRIWQQKCISDWVRNSQAQRQRTGCEWLKPKMKYEVTERQEIQ